MVENERKNYDSQTVILNNLTKLYTELTKGVITDPFTSAETVMKIHKSQNKDLVNKQVICNDMLTIVGKTSPYYELIQSYFMPV